MAVIGGQFPPQGLVTFTLRALFGALLGHQAGLSLSQGADDGSVLAPGAQPVGQPRAGVVDSAVGGVLPALPAWAVGDGVVHIEHAPPGQEELSKDRAHMLSADAPQRQDTVLDLLRIRAIGR